MGVAKRFRSIPIAAAGGRGWLRTRSARMGKPNTSPRWRRWPLAFESPLSGALTTGQPFCFRFLQSEFSGF